MPRDPRTITLTTKAPALTVTTLRGDGPPTMSGGVGGWESIPRPRRLALTVWTGRDQFALALPLLFDGFITGTLVDADVSKLERMALPPAVGKEPPTVKITGAVPHADLTWVIATFDWGDSIWAPAGGGRLRQAVTVNLLRYVAPDRIPARRRSGGGTGGKSKTVLAAQGDTLTTIAARELDDYSRWPELADLNGLRDPRAVTAGQLVRIP